MQGNQSRLTECWGGIWIERSLSLSRLQIPLASLRYQCGGTHSSVSVGPPKLRDLGSTGEGP